MSEKLSAKQYAEQLLYKPEYAADKQPDVKEKAEAILNELGIPTSTAINMFYRQIVLWNGLPFRPAKPPIRPLSRDEMTDEVFNARMAEGMAQARENQSVTIEEAFGEMMGENQKSETE